MVAEVGEGSLGELSLGSDCNFLLGVVNSTETDDTTLFDVLGGLDDITVDIHGVARSFGDGQTEVEGNGSWNATNTDQETPGAVDGDWVGKIAIDDVVLQSLNDDKGDKGSGKVTETLCGEG